MTGGVSGVGAAAAAGLAVHLLLAPPPSLRRSGGPVSRWGGALLAGVCGVAGVAAVGVLDGSRLVLALIALAVIAAVVRDLGRRRRAAAAEKRADRVLAMCDGLASDLRAGQPPVTALATAAEEWSELTPVFAAAELGADVPAALRALAAQPGAGQLRVVAAAWQVAHRSGAGLAGTLAMAAAHVRDDRETARVVATELAAAQATARLLALLPIGVLLLGSGLGGDPLGFLLDSTAGLVCLASGLALEYAGLSWLGRISDHVTRGWP
jgi:tight adherence protein B